ncbi:MAG: SGNH/GDSL hydrolase family protein [Bacteroidetes bacterium]|nr:MAG: SGNH/GDSL hydrolase family protein [Bacteroidota bacterium]
MKTFFIFAFIFAFIFLYIFQFSFSFSEKKLKKIIQKNKKDTTNFHHKKDTTKLNHLFAKETKNFIDLKIKNNKKIKIICFGNSITNGYKVGTTKTVKNDYPSELEKLLQKKYKNDSIKVIKEGKNGRRIDQALQYLPQIIAQKPDLVILEYGINDVYSNFSVDFFNQKMTDINKKLKEKNIFVIIASPTPILTPQNEKVWELTQGIYKFCKKNQIPFVNLYENIEKISKENDIEMKNLLPDKIHFADEYYVYLAKIIFEYIYF